MSLFNKLLSTDAMIRKTGYPLVVVDKSSTNGNLLDYSIYGNSSQSVLPSGYTQLEYIESSGTQYIDTGYLPALGTRFVVDAKFNNTARGRFGAYGNHSDGIRFYFGVVSSKWAVGYGSDSELNHSVSNADTNRHLFEINDSNFLIDNTPVLAYTRHWNSIIGNLFLFARSDGQSVTDYASATLYSSKIYDINNNLVRNFIPAKNSSNVVGMYDTVTNTFFTNAGTDSFTGTVLAPTPSAPIEVKGVGDRKQLWNSANKLNAYVQPVITTNPIVSNTQCVMYWFPIEAGKTYTVHSSVCNRFRLGFTTVQPAVGVSAKTVYIDDDNASEHNYTFTNTDNYSYCYAQVTNAGVEPDTFYANEGTIANGYQIPVVVGSNCGVVDLGTLTWSYRIDLAVGEFASNGRWWVEEKIAGKTNIYINGYTTVDKSATQIDDMEICGHETAQLIYIRDIRYTDAETFKQAMSGKYLYYQRTTDTSWTAPTITNIYLTKPLPKLGNKRDSINYKNQTLTMGTSYYEFTGNETFTSTYSTQFGYVFTCANILSGVQTSATASDMLCTHFRNSGASTDIKFSFTSGTNLNFAVQTTWTSTSDFKAWLTAQKTAGTPVTVYYPLQDDVTISVTTPTGGVALPAIPVKSGSNTLEVNTSVTPSEVDATAWCWRF